MLIVQLAKNRPKKRIDNAWRQTSTGCSAEREFRRNL